MLRVRASTYELGTGEWGDTETNIVRVFPDSSNIQKNQKSLTGSPITLISASIFITLAPICLSFLCVFPMRTLVIEFGSLSQDAHLKILKLCLLPNKITLTGSKDQDVDTFGEGGETHSAYYTGQEGPLG